MAHQLSGDDEHFDGTTDQYNGCCLFRSCRRGGIRSVRYLDWRSFGLLFSFPFLAIRSFFVGTTKTKPLSWAAAVAVAINIPLNYFLIFRCELGISGAAIASSLAEMVSLIVLCIYMWVKVDKEVYGLKPAFDGKLLAKVLNLSVWSMLHAFISVAPWFLFFIAIEHLGK